MPRYSLDLAAMRQRSSPVASSANGALASILAGLTQRTRIQAQQRDRASQRSFEITKFLAEDKDRQDRIAETKRQHDFQQQHDQQEDIFRARGLEDTESHQKAEEAHTKAEEDRQSKLDVETETHRTADDAERARHNRSEEDRQAKEEAFREKQAGAKDKAFDPYTTDTKIDPDTGKKVTTRRLKTADEVKQEKAVRDMWEGGDTAAPAGDEGTGPGWEKVDTHGVLPTPSQTSATPAVPAGPMTQAVPGGAPTAAAVPAAAPTAPGAAPAAPIDDMSHLDDLVGLENPSGVAAGGFTPAGSPAEGRARVAAQIPDFDQRYKAASGYFRGSDLKNLRMAVDAGDHEGVDYLLTRALSQGADSTVKEPDLPAHWQAARQAAQQDPGPATGAGPANAAAVQ